LGDISHIFRLTQRAYGCFVEYGNSLHSLIPLADFKNILGIDDRENALCRFVLIASTYTIEQYCKRRLLRKRRSEFFPFHGDYVFPLREYPVREILSVHQTHAQKEAIIVDPELYHTLPECGEMEDIPFCLSVTPAVRLVRETTGLRVLYRAGYAAGRVPADLASACVELAAWNLNRYRGQQLEGSMPENIKTLLEPYRRKTI
jgi:uncharacterized phiE125 gp8 family phage protein